VIEKLVNMAIATSTAKSYLAAFNSWTEFCSLPGVRADPFAPTEESLCFYAAWANSRGGPLSHASTQKYLYGIRSVLMSQGITFPSFHDMPLLERLMKGWKKSQYAGRSKPRLPVTVEILKKMMPKVEFISKQHRLLWAMLCTGVYGLFRSGELAPESKTTKGFLRLRDLSRDSKGHYRIFLAASKTDIWRVGVHVHILANGSSTCPVRALDAMLKNRDTTDLDAPLFSFDGIHPVTRTQLLKGMKIWLDKAGLNPDHYSGHSLRKGGAQSLYEAGVSDSQIMILGRWRSACFKLYVQLTEDIRSNISSLMANAKHSSLSP
jgi:hypothetical protein